jgi:hypothetical protein
VARTRLVAAAPVHYTCAMRGRRWWAAFVGEYRRTWRARLASVLLLVPVLWLSVLLLRVPAGTALSVPALLIDRVVLVSTAVVLPVAVLLLLVLPAPGMRATAIVAGTVSGVVGLPTLIAAWDPPRKALPVGLAVLSVVCGLALIALPLSTSLRSRRWRLSLLAPLSLLPIIQFWQATSYTPSQLITSVTPEVQIVVQEVDAAERHGVFEVSLANPGDVRASLFTSELVYCFVPEADWKMWASTHDDLMGNPECTYVSVVGENSHVDPQTTQEFSIPWTAPQDRSFATLNLQSFYVREDRLRPENTSETQASAAGCQGQVTTYGLQPDTRFKAVVQPSRLLSYDEVGFHLTYEGTSLCATESHRELLTRLGARFISVYRSAWLTDEPPRD